MEGWELHDGTGQVGPLDEDHVVRMILHGLPEGTVCRRVGEAEWRSLRSHPPFAVAMERRATQAMAPQPPAPQPVAYHAPAIQARPVSRNEFVGAGCIVQGLGIVAPFVFPGIFFMLSGVGAGAAMGLVIGLALGLWCFVTGRQMAIKWSCSACGNPIADGGVRVCPSCRASLG